MRSIIIVGICLALATGLFWFAVANLILNHSHEIAKGAGSLAHDFMSEANKKGQNP